jgi:desulfoferrodoxin (superoxide reductase-like protein)
LPPLEAEEPDTEHQIKVERQGNEYYVRVDHPMEKTHYISFIAAVSDQGVQFVKLYPESNAEAYFRIDNIKYFYAYCNRHGLVRL